MHLSTVAEYSSSRADRLERREDGNHSTPGAHGPQGASDRQGHHHCEDLDRDDQAAQAGPLVALTPGTIPPVRKEKGMARNSRQTSRSAAKAASKVLRGKSYSAVAKTAAASALSQVPKRRGK